jgi:23S rRNA (cytidine1920-2'-O)/16S rRNA (cytidine1409-2'-O)-methyltransferase
MRERLDKVMVDKGLVTSRSQAKSLIEKGDVIVNGQNIRKAGELIDTESSIQVSAPLFVGRGAFKLQKALEEFQINPKGLGCVDIGASTGGCTEVLLMKGAKKIYAIDVGHGQLAFKLINDPQVVNMEGTNIRDVHSLPELADLAVMDLSFISITKVLSNVSSLLRPNGELIVLIKPQFEVGKDSLPKDGVVKDTILQQKVLTEVNSFALANGWVIKQTIQSPIEGKSGNVEFLGHWRKL